MTDKMTREQRSKIMQAVKSKDSKLEIMVRRSLFQRGIRYRKHAFTLMGNPDISIRKYKIVIFIDSCFWHGCPEHYKTPESNSEFWDRKIEKNKLRDEMVTEYYRNKEWVIIRLWEHDIKRNLEVVINQIIDTLEEAKSRITKLKTQS